MPDIKNHILPDRDKLRAAYDTYKPSLQAVLSQMERSVLSALNLVSMPSFKSRVKDFDSYYRKLLRIKPDSIGHSEFPVLTDLLGIRIICAFLEDIASVEKQIVQAFDVVEIERKGADRTFSEFGYESVHILIKIPAQAVLSNSEQKLPPDLVCEIQIRTILQNAWAEVEHELVYKSEFSPFDLPLRRKLASMNASLSLADIIFQEIRDYQNKLNKELDCRRFSFYEQADALSQIPETASEKNSSKIADDLNPVSPYVHSTIDDLILEAIHAHNNGNMDRAVEIYTRIIESPAVPNPIVLSVIHKHRGMAFFAKNMYQEALSDFQKSIHFDQKNFRSYYYAGIVLSVLNEYEKSLEYFDESLKINEYQAHVYYRKSLSEYHLADYAAALSDLNKAVQLGLKNSDYENFQKLLVAKLDMGMK